ncbi:MAG: hypothetical protein KDA29_12825 [Phycisphaerales bacterium]|nr:hypothetical protein [Phycisphaerales bacterium]
MADHQEQYTIRRKFFKVFGAAFHVYDEHGSVIGYCKQKAFKLREDIKLYTGEDMSDLLLSLNTQQIIDFGATYNITLPDGTTLGSLRRKGLKSSFVRDEWLVFNTSGDEIAKVRETGSFAPIARRYIDYANIFFPQRYEITRSRDGKAIAMLRQHFNPVVFRMGVAIMDDDDDLDDLLILGAACLIAAIEGRQD